MTKGAASACLQRATATVVKAAKASNIVLYQAGTVCSASRSKNRRIPAMPALLSIPINIRKPRARFAAIKTGTGNIKAMAIDFGRRRVAANWAMNRGFLYFGSTDRASFLLII